MNVDIWYVSRKTQVNFSLLSHAIEQAGSWQDQCITATPHWLIHKLIEKIDAIDWNAAKKDVSRFLRARELASLELWSREFFLSRVEKLEHYLC